MSINLDAFAPAEEPETEASIEQAIADFLAKASPEEKLAMAGLALRQRAEQQSSVFSADAPKNPDELWQYIVDNWGIRIARVAVCLEHGHDAPFDFIALGFFELVPNLFCIASRGAGKSFDTALLMHLNSRLKSGCESMVFGAVDEQNRKVYDDMVEKFINGGLEDGQTEIVGEPLASLVTYVNGSKVRSFPGTRAKMNGQHPPKAHAEEVEIFNDKAYPESQPVDTMIPTPVGWRRFGDLEIGDRVFDRHGKPTTVTKIVELGERDVYRVKLTDRRETYCCDGHLWSVATTKYSLKRDRWKVVRLSEMIQRGLKLPTSYRYAIPHAGAVDFEIPTSLRIPPYVMGVVLGDGCISDRSVTFVSSDREIPDKVASLLPQYELSEADHNGSKRYCIKGSRDNSIISRFFTYGLDPKGSHEKFIPGAYKVASRGDRIELLRGLMDTDGHCRKNDSGAEFASVSKRLVEDLREIVFSLGGRAIMRDKPFKSEWSSGTLYTLDISFNDGTIPFSLERKALAFTQRTRTLNPSIKEIEMVGRAKCRCIGVDAPDSTYLTEGFIVTHNSRNMAASKTMPDGRVIKAQNFGTSTRKWKNGRVDKIYQSFLKAKKSALEKLGKTEVDQEVRELISITTPWYCVIYCLFEISSQVPNCRSAPENAGRPSEELCKCNIVQHGTWDAEGRQPRTFETVCRGRLFRSRGHKSYDEVIQLFLQNDRGTWEAQQECIEAETEGVYVKSFSKNRHGLQYFILDPTNGPIYTAVDWGTTHAACVLWVQYLERPVACVGYDGQPKNLKRGDRVVFSEIYEKELSSGELGEKVIAREIALAQPMSYHRIPVRKRWYDLAGAGDKRVWNRMGLKLSKYSTRVKSEHIKTVRSLYDADRAFVVVGNCPLYCDEIERWRADENGKEVDEDFNHAMAAGRYLFYGMHDVYQDDGAQSPDVKEKLAMAEGVVSTVAAPVLVSGKVDYDSYDDDPSDEYVSV